MKRIKTQKEIRFIDGTILAKGTSVLVEPRPTSDSKCVIATDSGQRYTLGWGSIIKPPTLPTIGKYCQNGYAKTPFGKRVEPDGYDEYGAPSWPLVMGFI